MKTNDDIRNHYTAVSPGDDLVTRITATVDALDPAAFEAASEAGFDQFHIRGIAATAELAKLAKIDASTYVLDAGSGFGGPSRYLAKTFGARVVGIDLTPAFVDVARMFTTRLNLGEVVTYEVGDLAALPFADRTFDLVWTQHVVMNVPDREQVYREFERVLKPGGKVAFYDVIAADDGESPHYPVPWAETEATSFLLTKEQTLDAFERTGFAIERWHDVTQEALTWFSRAPAAMPQGLSLATLLGPRFGAFTANFARNVREGRVNVVMGIGVSRA